MQYKGAYHNHLSTFKISVSETKQKQKNKDAYKYIYNILQLLYYKAKQSRADFLSKRSKSYRSFGQDKY